MVRVAYSTKKNKRKELTINFLSALHVLYRKHRLYRLDAGEGGNIFRGIGVNYQEILIEPEAASAIRGLTSESDAKALYTSGRNVMQDALKKELTVSLGPRGIIVEDVLLKDGTYKFVSASLYEICNLGCFLLTYSLVPSIFSVQLPDELSKSIELKAKAEQDAIRMQFVLQKEKQEADRKAIEAEGIANFQKIVAQGISPQYLKWKGIEATEKLAESKNAKLVVMGNSKNGLPVLLSADVDGAADAEYDV